MTKDVTSAFAAWLTEEEHSPATVEKYRRSVTHFYDWLGEKPLSKEAVVRYKSELTGRPSTINGAISAVNRLLTFLGHPEWKVHQIRFQQKLYRSKEQNLSKEEYERLIHTAERLGNGRLARIVETLGSTGMRVSELRFLTVEALNWGELVIRNKGKLRCILLTSELVRKLKQHCKRMGIRRGPVFVSRNGAPLARTQIWAELKRLCTKAGVDPRKGFPHNLRHLFALVHYRMHRDIAKLADLLGHSSVNTTRIYLMDTGEEHLRQLQAMRMVIIE